MGMDYETLETVTMLFTNAIIRALDECCPKRPFTHRGSELHWWSADLAQLKSEANRKWHAWRNSRSPVDLEAYKAARNEYQYEARRAKRLAWMDFCSTTKDFIQMASLMKIINSASFHTVGLLKR